MDALATTAHYLFDQEDAAPRELELVLGQVVACSRRHPHKEINQDTAALLPHPAGAVLAVADGMGGMTGGERAARVALETLGAHVAAAAPEPQALRSALLTGIEEANRAVLELGVGAGATLAVLLLREGSAQPVHVGDSMVLHVGQRGRVKSLTIPHSPTGYAVEAGLLTEEDAMHHAERHVVSNYLGFDGMRMEIGAQQPIAAHDTLLLASDGLADNLTLDEIVELLRKGPLLDAGRRLAALAAERMGAPAGDTPCKPDDLTFLLFRPSR